MSKQVDVVNCKCNSFYKSIQHISKHKGFKLATINVRSLLNKIDQLRIILHNQPIDILSVNETFLDCTIPTSQLMINGYVFERYDRGSRHGGGVGFYIRNTVKYELHKHEIVLKLGIEALFIKVKLPNRKPMIVGTMYRPPSANVQYFDNIVDVLEHIITDIECVIMGDLNYNYILDENVCSSPISYLSQLTGLSQLVTEPTRVTMTSSTLIDVILSTMPSMHIATGVVNLALSDHYMPYTVIAHTMPKSQGNFITIRSFKHFNEVAFLNDILNEFGVSATDCRRPFTDTNVNNMWTNWKANFEKICSHHAPIKVIKLKNRNNPWMNQDIIKAMHERDHYHQQAVRSKDPLIWHAYKTKRNEIVRMISNAQSNYYHNVVDQSNNRNRDMWKSLNHILNINRHSKIDTSINADSFNAFFTNIGKSLADKIDSDHYEWHLPSSIHELNITPIESNFVLKELQKLRNKSNLDVLNIDSKLLRAASHIIYNSLSDIINSCILCGDLPDDFKMAKVTPIYKNKGSQDDCGNYRPIYVICHVAKIMEKAIQVQLKEYLLKHNFISHVQSAYLQDHSTQSSLHNIVSDTFDSINCNHVNMLCFLDLQKCFDTIDHNILLCKLDHYGIRGNNLEFFKNYLNGRKQRVKVNCQDSSLLDIVYGVPQGSILGPILFLLYINDLPTCLKKCECNLFADDTVIYMSNNNDQLAMYDLQNDINNVCEWFTHNRLSVNIDKSCIMSISNKRHQNFNIAINDNQLLSVSQMKYLGVNVCNNLSWDRHISSICSKIGYGINLFYKLRYKINAMDMLKIYNTIIQPYIDYCITIWGYAPMCHLNKIQRLQNKIARIITNNYNFDVSPALLLSQLGVMNVTQRRDYFMSILMFKCVIGTAPSYLCDRINLASDYNVYNTRMSCQSMLYVPKPRVEQFRQSFQYIGPTLFNSLSQDIKVALIDVLPLK